MGSRAGAGADTRARELAAGTSRAHTSNSAQRGAPLFPRSGRLAAPRNKALVLVRPVTKHTAVGPSGTPLLVGPGRQCSLVSGGMPVVHRSNQTVSARYYHYASGSPVAPVHLPSCTELQPLACSYTGLAMRTGSSCGASLVALIVLPADPARQRVASIRIAIG